MSSWVVVVAAGSGSRMGDKTPKQFLPVQGRPLLAHTLAALLAHDGLDGAVVALPRGWLARAKSDVLARLDSRKPVRLVTGGASRAESVKRALAAVPATAQVVLVHDGARPVVARGLVDRLLAAVAKHGAAIPVLPATETLKERTPAGFVRATLDRSRIVAVQTPQAFERRLLERAYAKAGRSLARATDCSRLVERLGAKVAIVPGERGNVKVTEPMDLAIVANLIAAGTW